MKATLRYVTAFSDRHGKRRYRFRRKGSPSVYLPGEPGSRAFADAYAAALDNAAATPGAARTVPGSVGDALARYLAVPDRLGPTPATRAKVRGVLERFAEGRRDRPLAGIRFDHIEAIVARARVKRTEGKRQVGGVEAARKLRKELVRFFAFAVRLGMLKDNPAADSAKVRVAAGERSKGWHSWSEVEIAQYRARHPLGSKARLAMELLLWTDQRRGDVYRLGRQHIRDGRFHIVQGKTGKAMGLAVPPQLLEAIVAMPPAAHLCFLVTDAGQPYTYAGFGNWLREQCDAAGLPGCSAHGLRKATMRRMAELDMGNQTMKAVSGHSKDNEVAHYTAAANQQRMADAAILALARWERAEEAHSKSNPIAPKKPNLGAGA